MNKTTQIILAVVAVVAIVGLILMMNLKPASNLSVNRAEDLTVLVDQIYKGVSIEMPMLMTQELDMTDAETVKYFTGLENIDDIEYVVASEPMMSSQAYSLVLVKAKDGADVESMKQQMLNNIDTRKWICVEAEKVYVTNYNNLICLVMSNEEAASKVHNSFKNLVNGEVGKVLVRTTSASQ